MGQWKPSPVILVGLINKPIPERKKNSVSFLWRARKRQCWGRHYNFFLFLSILLNPSPEITVSHLRKISSLWSAMKYLVMSSEVSVGLMWLRAACILMLRVMFLHCWRISVVCLDLELVGFWVELGFSVGMEAFGWALVNWCSLESGVFWCSQVLDLSFLPLAFSLILTVASRLLYPYSTNDKTFRLMVKRFSTVRNTWRGSQS